MCHTWKSYTWKWHVTQIKTSCHRYEGVMSHVWMRHVTHMNASCHTYECVMSHVWICNVTHMRATHMKGSCHTDKCVMSLWMSQVTLNNACCTRLVGSFKVLVSLPFLGLFCRALFAKETYNFKDPTNASCHTQQCMSHTWVRRVTNGWVMSHEWMRHVTHMNTQYRTYECVMSHTWRCLHVVATISRLL